MVKPPLCGKSTGFSNGSGCCYSGLHILDLCFQLDLVFIKVNFVQYIQTLFVILQVDHFWRLMKNYKYQPKDFLTSSLANYYYFKQPRSFYVVIYFFLTFLYDYTKCEQGNSRNQIYLLNSPSHQMGKTEMKRIPYKTCKGRDKIK